MAEEAGRMLEQETMQLCVLGKTLAEDADFLDTCRGFKVFLPIFWNRFEVENSEKSAMLLLVFVIIVGWQVPVLTSEDGMGLIGKGEPGVSTFFVHQHFSGDKSYQSNRQYQQAGIPSISYIICFHTVNHC